jgi:hypothetical protein
MVEKDRLQMSLLSFQVDLPRGKSILRARYRAKASGTHEYTGPVVTWLLPYVLAPAREWKSFGGPEVRVLLPDWEASSTPELEREGDELRGDFPGLPADYLMLAARAPLKGAYERASWQGLGFYSLVLLGGAVLCWVAGRWLGRRVARSLGSGWLILAGVFLGSLWSASLFGAWRLSWWWVGRSLAGQESPYFHETFWGPACGNVLLMVLVFPVSVCIAAWGAGKAR